jgi:hypothetical protein
MATIVNFTLSSFDVPANFSIWWTNTVPYECLQHVNWAFGAYVLSWFHILGTAMTLMSIVNSIVSPDIFLAFVGIGSLLNFGFLQLLAIAISDPAPDPLCGGYYASPADSVGQLFFFFISFGSLRVNFIGVASVYEWCIYILLTVAVGAAKLVFQMNTVMQLVQGAAIGAMNGLFWSHVMYRSSVYFDAITNWRFFRWRGWKNVMTTKLYPYK